MLYGTTKEFLKVFGLASLDDLPAVKGLSPEASAKPSQPEPEKAQASKEKEEAKDDAAHDDDEAPVSETDQSASTDGADST